MVGFAARWPPSNAPSPAGRSSRWPLTTWWAAACTSCGGSRGAARTGQPLAVAAAGVAALAIVLCFAEASSHFEEPGSAYLYARHAFGAFVGFEVGWMSWLARVASVASLSVGFAQA